MKQNKTEVIGSHTWKTQGVGLDAALVLLISQLCFPGRWFGSQAPHGDFCSKFNGKEHFLPEAPDKSLNSHYLNQSCVHPDPHSVLQFPLLSCPLFSLYSCPLVITSTPITSPLPCSWLPRLPLELM